MIIFVIKFLKIIRKVLFLIMVAIAFLPENNIAHADEMFYRIMANICYSCHGLRGQGAGNIPGINRMNSKQLERQLKAFRDGKRESTIMQRIAKGLTNDEIKIISVYITKNVQ